MLSLLSPDAHWLLERRPADDAAVLIEVDDTVLKAECMPLSEAQGVVIFASGTGRNSPRNRYVAECLRSQAQVAVLLVDLASEGERSSPHSRQRGLDIELLAARLIRATDWMLSEREYSKLPVGYVGSSTGAAAALLATLTRPEAAAVVSRGGRVDLAGRVLNQVTCATLLLAGQEDSAVLELNRLAHKQLGGLSELLVVPGTSYLFEEPAALDEVAARASSWFTRFLRPAFARSGVFPEQ